MCAYWRKGAKHFDPILSGERMRRVHGGEVGQPGWRVCRGPAQDVTQLWGVGINRVPRHKELRENTKVKTNRMIIDECGAVQTSVLR